MLKRLSAVFAMLFVMFVLTTATAPADAIPGWTGSSSLPANFYVEVAKGNVPGHSIVHKFGNAIVTTSMVPITNSLAYMTPTTAIALELVAADADDTSAGAGAQAVTIEGLALDGSVVTQIVELNGLTPVPIPTSLWRLRRWWVSRSGVYGTPLVGSHQGDLTIRVAGVGATWSIIEFTPYPHGQSEIGWYTVQAGYRAYILSMSVTSDSTKSVDIIALRRENGDDVATPFDAMRIFAEATGVAGEVDLSLSKTPVNGFGEFADFGLCGIVAANTAAIAVHVEIMLVKDGF